MTARFLGVVGESFESVVPTKPGAVVTRWEIEDGSLPSGLGLDPASGAITGVPEESTAGRALAMRGLAPSGEMGTYASVRIDVLQARPEAYRQDLYAHTGKPFSKRLEAVAGATVYTWTPIVQFPEWASVDQGFVNAVPTEAGVWPSDLSPKQRLLA